MRTLERARAIAAELTDAARGAGLDALATTKPRAALTALTKGTGVLLIGPPAIAYGSAYGSRDVTWTITAAVRQTGGEQDTAWRQLDALLDLVADTFGDLDTATPGQFNVPGQDNNITHPAYVIRCLPEALPMETPDAH